MEPSPAKRRRTAPPSQDASQNISSRPSYMSPTKTSLARFHSNIVPQPTEPTTLRSKGRLLLDQRVSAIQGGRRSASKVSQPPDPISAADATFLNSVARAAGALLVGSQDDASSQADKLPPISSQVSHSTGRTLSVPELIVDNRDPEPRASPPMDAADVDKAQPISSAVQCQIGTQTDDSGEVSQLEDAEARTKAMNETSLPELGNSSDHHKQNQSTTSDADGICSNDEDLVLYSTPTRRETIVLEDNEPRLPSTPRQLGIEPPRSMPTGILSTSPNQKSERRRLSGTKSSPLKPKDVAPMQHVVETQDESSLGPRRSIRELAARTLESLDQRLEHFHTYPRIAPITAASALPKSDPLYKVIPFVSLNISASYEMTIKEDGVGHSIRDVIFRSPNSILVVEIRMFLKEGSNKVTSITILGLSSWASSELGTWLKAPIADRTQDAIARAVGRFWDMTETRACCWYDCRDDFDHLIDHTVSPTSKNAIQTSEPVSISEDFLSEKLVNFLGRETVRFKDSAVSLHVTWAIDFTPSGEVTSRVSAHASFPPSWAKEQNDLSRVDQVFARLVRLGKPVHEAICCVIEVIFPK